MIRSMFCAAAVALAATGANAAVVSSTSGIYEGFGSVSFDPISGLASFAWDTGATPGATTPFAGFVAFEADTVFDLTLTSYEDLGGGPDGPTDARLSGIVLETTSGTLNGATDGTRTEDVAGCGQFLFSVWDFASCNYVGAAGYTGPFASITAEPGEILFSGLGPGFYRIEFGDSGTPVLGTASITISDTAVIPLPATLPLVLASLGAFGVLSRRRKT